MNAYQITDMLRTTRITSIPLRVAAYSRVSTDSIEQKTSIVNQKESHREFISEHPAWTYAGEYIDEGISGLSVKKRDEFNRMIRDAKEGKFDLIIAKEISRFARNTLDSIQYTRDLLNAIQRFFAGIGKIITNDYIISAILLFIR